jgi:hypothetical protein
MKLSAFLNSASALTLVRWQSMGWKSKGMAVCGITLIVFAAGAVVSAGVVHANQARAESRRVFELRIYHAVPGKMPALEARFRDTTSQLLAKHDLNVVGYWVAEDAAAADNTLNNTFAFMLAHASREEAEKNWRAVWSDPGFQAMVKSEQANKLVEKVSGTYMHPTEYSPLK